MPDVSTHSASLWQRYRNWLRADDTELRWWFTGFVGLAIAAVFGAVISGFYALAGLPIIVLVFYLAIVDYRPLFWLLLFCLPLSTEVTLGGGLGTDLPTGPLMIGLTLVYCFYALRHFRSFSGSFIQHPITLLLLLHLAWSLTSTVFSDLPLVSIKFMLAKTWYVVTFYFLAASLLRRPNQFRRFFWIIFIPLALTVVVALVRHASFGFSFKDVHRILYPFQRNHVNYAADLALFFPWIILAITWYRRWSWRQFLLGASLVLFLVAIYFSYTRAAYVALIIAAGYYFVVRLRLTAWVLLLVVLIGGIQAVRLMQDNAYLDYAPNFERTITHTEFDNLIEATYELEDISTMERVYRWVAGSHMIRANPWLGYGPGNFVNFYKPFAVTSFETYVSDNPEQSGIHSYYLMVLVEQGVPGALIFLVFTGVVLIYGERIFHQTSAPERRKIVITTLASLVVIDSFLLINDLLETDKVGAFYFMFLAILVNIDLENRRELRATDIDTESRSALT